MGAYDDCTNCGSVGPLRRDRCGTDEFGNHEEEWLCPECWTEAHPDEPRTVCGCDVKRTHGAPCPECGCNCNPLEQTGGGHRYDCPAFEPECTCYEVTGGHMPGCYFNRNPVG